jgi:bifunctional non-homologous end joining protein LigD
MPLDRYRAKRDFARTPEPAPGAPPWAAAGAPAGGRGRFVVHRHRATRHHYDLRLEIDGVLASWAVPHGPTRDPGAKRLAMRTEDHPIEYLDFEGVIPAGEYGAGDSICWDWGTFQAEETWDPADALARGELKLRLWGEKLTGRWTLVRTGGRGGDAGRRDERAGQEWLLVTKSGPDAVEGWDPADHPASVKTGRTNEEVAAGVAPLADAPPPAPLATLDPPGSQPAAQPAFLEPMLATPATAAFNDPDWLFEPKWDGYRVQAIVAGGRVSLRTRNGHDAGAYFPELLGDPVWLAAPEAIVDGEVVALGEDGKPDFELLRARDAGRPGRSDADPTAAGRSGVSPGERALPPRGTLRFIAFDLPWCAGRSYLDVALEDRREILRLVLRDDSRVAFAPHIAREGVAFYAAVAAQGLEGAMAKHRRSRYTPGRRSNAWLKIKVRPTEDLVVGGYVRGQGSHRDLGALVVGVREEGRLRYAGRVGSGLDEATRRRLGADLDARARPRHPFDVAPADLQATPGAVWADPALVIRATIGGWTRAGLVRHASYAGDAPEADPGSVERQVAAGTGAVGDLVSPGPAAPRRRASRERDADVAGPAFAGPTADEIAALDALPARGGAWSIGGRTLTLTSLDRVLAPGRAAGDHAPLRDGPDGLDGGPGVRRGRRPDTPDVPPVTKRDLVRYLAVIAPVMLPHLAGRALNVVRFPQGIDGTPFWQRDIGRSAPRWVTRWREPDPPDRQPHVYALADAAATLAWLGTMGAVEIHPWTSRVSRPGEPRWALVDIDPGPATSWEETLVLARLYRRAFEHLGVAGAPKVSGKRGIQIVVPLRPGYTYEETRDWVERVSRAVGAAVPELVSWEWSKDRRDGRARLDYTQNWGNRTLVSVYSPRPAPGLPVSAPIGWDELDDPALRPDRWTIATILERVAARGDLFTAALGPDQTLPAL